LRLLCASLRASQERFEPRGCTITLAVEEARSAASSTASTGGVRFAWP
jgi:hypothetical protein